VAVAREVELDQQRHLVGQANLDLGRQRGRLAEVGQVLEREGQRDGLAELDLDALVGLVEIGVLPERDGSVADVALARELDAVLVRIDSDCGDAPLARGLAM
jgi:hypothetical protein